MEKSEKLLALSMALGMAWLEENVLAPISWKGKTLEHSMHVSDNIEKIDLAQEAYCNQCGDVVSCSSSGKNWLPGLVVYGLVPPTLVYSAALQPGLFSVYCLMHFNH